MDIRFKDAALLLGSQDSSSIFAGVFALHQIAVDCKAQNRLEYVYIIKEIFCGKVRENQIAPVPAVIQTILNLLVKSDTYLDCLLTSTMRHPKEPPRNPDRTICLYSCV